MTVILYLLLQSEIFVEMYDPYVLPLSLEGAYYSCKLYGLHAVKLTRNSIPLHNPHLVYTFKFSVEATF
jgi:hypothetical protein